MPRVLAILKYAPAVLCGMLTVAWVVNLYGTFGVTLPSSTNERLGASFHFCDFAVWKSSYQKNVWFWSPHNEAQRNEAMEKMARPTGMGGIGLGSIDPGGVATHVIIARRAGLPVSLSPLVLLRLDGAHRVRIGLLCEITMRFSLRTLIVVMLLGVLILGLACVLAYWVAFEVGFWLS